MLKMTGRIEETDTGETQKDVPRPMSCQYESGTRSSTWLKLKRDYVSGFADTLDVVPIGKTSNQQHLWLGNGKSNLTDQNS